VYVVAIVIVMDKENSRQILESILKEYPDLIGDLRPEPAETIVPRREKMIVISIRAPVSTVAQVEKLVEQLGYKKADIIRYALKLGLTEMEKKPATETGLE